MCLAEGVTARDERDGLFIVHAHAGEGLAHITTRSDRVGVAIGSFGVDVDQAHLHRREWIFQIAFAAIAFVAEPFGFGTPVNIFFGLPNVGATAAKAEGLKAHRLKRHVTGEDEQICP